MDEPKAVQLAQVGDRQAFAWLVCAYQDQLRALVAMAVANHDDILDVVQESFIDAWRGLPGFDTGREFGPWLRTVCRNRIRQFLRQRIPRRRRELAVIDAALLVAPTTEDPAPDERVAALRVCISALEPAQRVLIERRYIEDVPVQRLAADLGKSPNAVSMLLLRLKEALMRCMDRQPPGVVP